MSDDASSGLEEGANIDRASLLKRLAIGGAALSLPSLAGAEAAFGSVQDVAASAAAVWPKHPKWKFALINHVTTNPFFVPTQYGAADAAKMLDVSYTWTRLDQGRRRRDDQRVQRGHQRQGRRHRRLRRRQGGVRGADQAGARPGHPRRRIQRRRRAHRQRRPGRPTSARTSTCPGSRWASGSLSSCRGATWRSSSRRRERSTSSPGSTAQSPRSRSRASR